MVDDMFTIPGIVFSNVSSTGEYRQDLNNRLLCPDCKVEYAILPPDTTTFSQFTALLIANFFNNTSPPNLTEEFSSGDIVCADCGVVVGDRIVDTRSEWRTFANDNEGDDPSRVGDAPDEFYDGDQLETTIAFDGTGGRVGQALRQAHKKITEDKGTKTLKEGYGQITEYCEAINTGKAVIDTAKWIFKMVEDKKGLKGKPQEAIVAGCIFIACRQMGAGRTFQEIYNLTRVSKKEIGRVFKALEKFLRDYTEELQQQQGTAPGNPTTTYTAAGSTSADELCIRFCSDLGFRNPVQIEKVSRFLVGKALTVKGLAGRSPLSVAGACIYAAAHLMKEPKSAREVATVAGISEGTVKTAYKILHKQKDKVIYAAWLRRNKARVEKLPAN